MKITYIGKNGNIKETEDVLEIPSNLEKIGMNWFEKRIKIEEVVEVKEVKEVKIELSDNELKAKEYLKEKKVKGYGLLKGDNLIKKAIEEGFIIN